MKKIRTKIFTAIVLAGLFLPAFTDAAGYDFFVNKSYAGAVQDGSEVRPFKSIGAALSHIEAGNLKKKNVYVKNGTYREAINITRNTRLIGESKGGTILDANGLQTAVNFVSTKSEIRNFTVRNSESTNVIIDKKSKATIQNCKIEKAGKLGIEVKESSAKSKYKFTIKDSEITENGTKGFHISKRKISVSGNEISDNGEEGIDLHSGQKGTVSNNDIHGNGESGVELILAGANLKIRNNEVENNDTQGITVQVYSAKRKGKVKLERNTIKGNDGHGVRFANYTRSIGPNKFKIFADKYVKLSKNTISDNGREEIYYE